ncbi:MAG: 6-phosphogluconolactonase [Magnetococcus sp. YQC-9]
MNPLFHFFAKEHWAELAARKIHAAVEETLLQRGVCHVMLTGGRSAANLYAAWRSLPDFSNLQNVHFYFGDERCVPPDDPQSNYGMTMRTLFAHHLPGNCRIARMEAESGDLDAACTRYAARLPDRIDILLLGVGEDGHIASCFPHTPVLSERLRKVVPVRNAPKPPSNRMTVTPAVICTADTRYILALSKQTILEEALSKPEEIVTMPVRMVTGAHWLMDEVA